MKPQVPDIKYLLITHGHGDAHLAGQPVDVSPPGEIFEADRVALAQWVAGWKHRDIFLAVQRMCSKALRNAVARVYNRQVHPSFVELVEQLFMVERDLKGIAIEDLAAAQKAATGKAEEMRDGGSEIHYILTTFALEDRRCMSSKPICYRGKAAE